MTNLGFKFRSHFTRIANVLLAVLLAGGSSRAMLASAKVSCLKRLAAAMDCTTSTFGVDSLFFLFLKDVHTIHTQTHI